MKHRPPGDPGRARLWFGKAAFPQSGAAVPEKAWVSPVVLNAGRTGRLGSLTVHCYATAYLTTKIFAPLYLSFEHEIKGGSFGTSWDMRRELDGFPTYFANRFNGVDAKFAGIDTKFARADNELAQLRENQVTHALVLQCAVKTLRAWMEKSGR
ncbi:hypothetical protein HOY80DRAFT_1068458 [Tuber brumale]|nr:hypothetical protein HOY80DRAFT_1068458 [Tuber brumale]